MLFWGTGGYAQKGDHFSPIQWSAPNSWADSLLATLTLDEKIGQLFMTPVYSRDGVPQLSKSLAQVKSFHIGGVIMMQGGPGRQINMVNALQAASDVPLLVAQDAEWGLAMRLDSTWRYPRQLTLGAIKDPTLIYDMGQQIAAHCRRVGVQVNFAPVVDINNNINNPVINDRSFGENRYNVTLRGLQYMKGMQDHGVMACAKHFPGHGDTDKDSHKDLPVIPYTRDRLDSLELFPFKLLISQGIMSMMTAHLYIPQLEPTENLASSLSEAIVHDILQDEMGFEGLVFTDALNMQGASGFNKPGEMEVKALLAGNDVLLFPSDLAQARASIKAAIAEGRLTEERIDRSARKILQAKYWAGLHEWQPLSADSLYEDLVGPEEEALHRRLLAHAITIAHDPADKLPFRMIDTTSFAVLEIGTPNKNFAASFQRYANAAYYAISHEANSADRAALLQAIDTFDAVVTVVHDMSRYKARGFGLTKGTRLLLDQLSAQTGAVICLMGSPYSLSAIKKDAAVILVGYEDSEYSNDIVPQLLFGGLPAKGRLPVSAGPDFQFGKGKLTTPIRLSYGLPEEIGLRSSDFSALDFIAKDAILKGATPGCQVLVAKENKVIYQKNFGYHTYARKKPVDTYDLYDLASITKIAATTLSLMYLTELGQFDLDLALSDYVPELLGTNLAGLKIRDVLTHTAGLTAWIPFYASTVDPALYDLYYCDYEDSTYCIPVARGIYMREDYRDSIMAIIAHSEVDDRGDYRYSDLGFYLFKQIIENTALLSIDAFTESLFYKPLGLRHFLYKPLTKYPPDQIVPTEQDGVFRRQLLDGYVHDPGAAMWGGVSGHAGLFANTNDLAIVMQMLLNGGTYGGEQFLQRETIHTFTRRQNNASRRGLGFDKPETDPNKDGPTGELVSPRTYGHTGFTGTCVWVDPEYDVVFVFLSNRIHPTAENKKLIKMDVRTRMQDAVYEAIIDYSPQAQNIVPSRQN